MARKLDELSEGNQKFLNALFGPAEGNLKAAAKMAGYEENSCYYLVRSLEDEIIELGKHILAKYTPQAAITLGKAAAGESEFISNSQLAAAQQVLDRVGLSRKDNATLTIEAPNGIFILPEKRQSGD